MPMVVILPRTGRSPFQLYLIGLVALSGIAILSGFSTNMVFDAMGEPGKTIWGMFLTIGGMSILLGIYWPKDPFTGMLIERSGLVALGGACLIFTFIIIWKAQRSGVYTALLTFALFAACLAQWRWINKNVNKVMTAIDGR